MRRQGMLAACGLVVVGALALLGTQRFGANAASPAPNSFTVVNVTASGAKIWLPSTVATRSGQQVSLVLDNKLDEAHGFAIDDYGIRVVVQPKSKQTVTFTAKPGVSRFYCHLHPAHVGGQVIVL